VVWIELSKAILEQEMSSGNPRLNMAKENEDKINKFGVKRLAEVKTWWLYVRTKGKAKGGKKGGKKGKK